MLVVPKAVQDSGFNPVILDAKLTSAYKLLRINGFDHVMQAQNISSKCYRIYFVANTRGNARLGIVTSKKTIPRSVDRNKAKRLVRETFRKHKIKSCEMDLVVMLRPVYAKDTARCRNELESILDKVQNRCVV